MDGIGIIGACGLGLISSVVTLSFVKAKRGAMELIFIGFDGSEKISEYYCRQLVADRPEKFAYKTEPWSSGLSCPCLPVSSQSIYKYNNQRLVVLLLAVASQAPPGINSPNNMQMGWGIYVLASVPSRLSPVSRWISISSHFYRRLCAPLSHVHF